MNFSANQQQSGFILMTVLVVSTLMISLGGAIIYIINNQLNLAERSAIAFQHQLAADNKVNELIYLFSTQRVTVGGISRTTPSAQASNFSDEPISYFALEGDEIRTDGKKYQYQQGEVSLEYWIQGTRGLIPINTRSHFWLEYFLTNKRISRYSINRFSDLIIDYADADQSRQPLGAESQRYGENQFFPNFLLQHCSELDKIATQFDLPSPTLEVSKFCNLERKSGLNFNSVPISLMEILWPDISEQVAQDRDNGIWIHDLNQLNKYSNTFLGIPDIFLNTTGNNQFIISVNSPHYSNQYLVELGKHKTAPFSFMPVL